MNVIINIKMLNAEFNQALADELYGGEESEDNIKYIWEDEFEVVGDIANFQIKNNATFCLKGVFPDGKSFSFEIPSTTIIVCESVDGDVSEFPISKKLIKETHKLEDKANKTLLFSVVLKDQPDYVNPLDGAYFLKQDFPEELMPYQKAIE